MTSFVTDLAGRFAARREIRRGTVEVAARCLPKRTARFRATVSSTTTYQARLKWVPQRGRAAPVA